MADAKEVTWEIKSQLAAHEALGTENSYSAIVIRKAISVIEELQADIARLHLKKGKWIEIESQTGVGAFGFNEVTVNAFRCSECRKKIDVSDGDFKYCPYCGADMRGGDGDADGTAQIPG